MNTRTILFGTALLAPVLLSSGSALRATRIKFGPADGTSLTKTFETKAQLTQDEYSIEGTGSPQQPKIEMTMTTGQKIVVTDEYVKVKDGVSTKLKRTYDELGSDSAISTKMEIMGQSNAHDQSTSGESELQGKTVVFTWDADKGEYKKSFDPAQSKEELLTGLAEDMDLRCCLPTGEVKEGEEWDVSLKGLRDVLMPGGNLSLVPKSSDDSSPKLGMDPSSMTQAIGDKLEGTAKAKLTSLKDVDGAKVATIHLEIKIRSKADLTEAAKKMLKSGELPPQVESLDIDHLDVDFHFEGEGDVVWDVGGGHFRSLELTGQQTVKSETGMSVGVQGRKLNLTESKQLSGTASYSAKAK